MRYRDTVYLARILDYLKNNGGFTYKYDVLINGEDYSTWVNKTKNSCLNIEGLDVRLEIRIVNKSSYNTTIIVNGYEFFFKYILPRVENYILYNKKTDRELIENTREIINSMLIKKEYGSTKEKRSLESCFCLLTLILQILQIKDKKERNLFLLMVYELYSVNKNLFKKALLCVYNNINLNEKLNPDMYGSNVQNIIKEVFKSLAIKLKDILDFIYVLGKYMCKIQDSEYIIEFYNILLPYFGEIFIKNKFVNESDIGNIFEQICDGYTIQYSIFTTISKNKWDSLINYIDNLETYSSESNIYKWAIFYCSLILIDESLEKINEEKEVEKCVNLIMKIPSFFDHLLANKCKEFVGKYLEKYGFNEKLIQELLTRYYNDAPALYYEEFKNFLLEKCPENFLPKLRLIIGSIENTPIEIYV